MVTITTTFDVNGPVDVLQDHEGYSMRLLRRYRYNVHGIDIVDPAPRPDENAKLKRTAIGLFRRRLGISRPLARETITVKGCQSKMKLRFSQRIGGWELNETIVVSVVHVVDGCAPCEASYRFRFACDFSQGVWSFKDCQLHTRH